MNKLKWWFLLYGGFFTLLGVVNVYSVPIDPAYFASNFSSLLIGIKAVECHAKERSDEASLAGHKSRQAWVETPRFARGDTYLLETN
jgi:hypothetical protein